MDDNERTEIVAALLENGANVEILNKVSIIYARYSILILGW